MYSQTQYEFLLTPANATAAVGPQGIAWSAGLVPHIIRGFTLTVVTGPVTNAVMLLQQQSYAAGSELVIIATLNLKTSDVAGTTVFLDNLNAEAKPGERVYVQVPVAIPGMTFRAALLVEPRWERPENLALMRKSD